MNSRPWFKPKIIGMGESNNVKSDSGKGKIMGWGHLKGFKSPKKVKLKDKFKFSKEAFY